MSRIKTFLAVAFVLVAVTVFVFGSAMAADKEPATTHKTFKFHFWPFGPGLKNKGPAPEKGHFLLDTVKGATKRPSASLAEGTAKAVKTKP